MRSVRELVAAQLALPVDAVPEDAEAGRPAEWDSLRHLELMLAVEMEYLVQIPADRMFELISIQEIRDFLTSQGVAADG